MDKSELTYEVLHDLYMTQKLSPERIGEMVNLSGRSIRYRMDKLNLPRLNATHLRKGVSAIWNIGLERTPEAKERNRQKHLGQVPHNKGQGSVTFTCESCGQKVTDKPYRRKRTCSYACRTKLMGILRGKDHWNYKGLGRQTQRLWAITKDWRIAVFNRDSHECQGCKQRGGRLTAHHLDSWATHPASRFDIANGVTLCWQCHRTFHSIYGQKHTIAPMFTEWLTTLQ